MKTQINIVEVMAGEDEEQAFDSTMSTERANKVIDWGDRGGVFRELREGEEIEVDRARITQNGVFVRKDGMWIELRPLKDMAP